MGHLNLNLNQSDMQFVSRVRDTCPNNVLALGQLVGFCKKEFTFGGEVLQAEAWSLFSDLQIA